MRFTSAYILLVILLYPLSACNSEPSGDISATYTAQALRARSMATQIAQSLRGTSEVFLAQAAATHQVLGARETQLAIQKQATRATLSVRSTATAAAFQSLIQSVSAWPLALSDSFDSNTNGWPEGESTDEYGVSRWSMIDGKYRWEAEAKKGFVWWATPDKIVTEDFFVLVTIQQLSNLDKGGYGVVFRLRNDVDYYLFEITPAGYFGIFLHSAAGWQTLLGWVQASIILREQPNRIAVLASGSDYYFLVNDQLLARLADNRLSEGEVGLMIGLFEAGDQAVWEFDDFELRAPEIFEEKPSPTSPATIPPP